ncbi:hypothetical protein C8R45DRAFT_971798 [Mycena sanguinolenta]|nr:hypothetical protein C8R45DRAFT_971798 [Mycena sanguinolenta]
MALLPTPVCALVLAFPAVDTRVELSCRYTTAELPRVSLRRDLGRVVQPHGFLLLLGRTLSAAAGELRIIVETFLAHGLDISAFTFLHMAVLVIDPPRHQRRSK